MINFDDLKVGDIFTFLSPINKIYFYIYYKKEFIIKYIRIEKLKATYEETNKEKWSSRDFIFSRCTSCTEQGLIKTLFGDKHE